MLPKLLLAPMFSYSTPELVSNACLAGVLGCLPPQKSIDALKDSISFVKSTTRNLKYAVNITVFPTALINSTIQKPLQTQIVDLLNSYRRELGIPENPPPRTSLGQFSLSVDEQVDIVIKEKVPVVIFTYGIPDVSLIEKLRGNSVYTIGSATSVSEALMIQAAGLDAVVLQGAEAGGHRTSPCFPHSSGSSIGLLSLIAQAKSKASSQPLISIPIIAAGGICNSSQIKAVLTAGADAVSIGSLFLTAKECRIPQEHRNHLFSLTSSDPPPVTTRIFTGRPAQLIPNRFYYEMKRIVDMHGGEDACIPWDFQTRDIFAAASKANRKDLFCLWAGQSALLLSGMPARPVAEIIRDLAFES